MLFYKLFVRGCNAYGLVSGRIYGRTDIGKDIQTDKRTDRQSGSKTLNVELSSIGMRACLYPADIDKGFVPWEAGLYLDLI